MEIATFHIDTFTESLFAGNPATVCVLERWLPEELLTKIARENNQPATAFLVPDGPDFAVRWFHPDYEIPLCGHGTLAAAFLIFNYLGIDKEDVSIIETRGRLNCEVTDQGVILSGKGVLYGRGTLFLSPI